MADKGSIAAIKAEIDEKIIPNNNAQLITGEKLKDTLQDTVDTLDAQHRAAIQQVADNLDTEREVREAEEDDIRNRIDEVDAAQAAGVNSALQQITAEKAAREGLAQEVSQQGTRLTAAEGVGTTNTADIAVLTGKAAVAATEIQQLKNRATNDEAVLADHEQRITENAGAVSGLRERATILEGEVGDLSTLHTTDKASLVRAINEVLGNPAIARYLFVSWSEKIRLHAANFVALMNNYDMIVVRSRGTVITTYHDTSAIMYEYSEGWRIGTLEGLTLDDETSFRDMLEYLDEHSSFIASKADIAVLTGDLSDLTTEDKSSLVGAINEVKEGAGKAIPDFARNLVPTGAPSEVEFSSRPTEQGIPGILGSEEVKVVKGKSLVWNQLVVNNTLIDLSGWETYGGTASLANGVVLMNFDGTIGAIRTQGQLLSGHKYLIAAYVKSSSPAVGLGLYYSTRVLVNHSGSGSSELLMAVYSFVDASTIDTIISLTNGVSGYSGVVEFSMPCVYDLTQLGDADILAASDADAIALFKARYGHFETSYNEGEIVNNSVKAIEVTGESGNKTTIDLEWVKDIKDGDGNILFPDGLRGVGNVYDEAGQSRAVKRFGNVMLENYASGFNYVEAFGGWYFSRFAQIMGATYASGASAPNLKHASYVAVPTSASLEITNTVSLDEYGLVVNNGSTTEKPSGELVYELAEPIEVTYPKQETLAAIEGGGIETAIADGNSAPFKGAILYGLDVYKTLVSLVQAQAATTAEE